MDHPSSAQKHTCTHRQAPGCGPTPSVTHPHATSTQVLSPLLEAPRSCSACAGLLYAGSLWLSNSSYLYLSVSFIQMTKSLMPGLVYASGVMLGTEKYSRGVTLNMLMIAFGVVICAMGEMNLVVKGLVQQLTALGFEVRLVLPRVLLSPSQARPAFDRTTSCSLHALQ